MAIHHSATCGVGMERENGCRGIFQWGADFTDQALSVCGLQGKGGANCRKNCAGADWFRHVLQSTLLLWQKPFNLSIP